MTLEIEEATKRKVKVYDVDGNLADPTSMTITIWIPDGTKDIDAVAMTNDATGEYSYWYTIANQVGNYKILFEATTGGKVSKQRDNFDVVAEL